MNITKTNNNCKIVFTGDCIPEDIILLTALLRDNTLSFYDLDLQALNLVTSALLSIMVQMKQLLG